MSQHPTRERRGATNERPKRPRWRRRWGRGQCRQWWGEWPPYPPASQWTMQSGCSRVSPLSTAAVSPLIPSRCWLTMRWVCPWIGTRSDSYVSLCFRWWCPRRLPRNSKTGGEAIEGPTTLGCSRSTEIGPTIATITPGAKFMRVKIQNCQNSTAGPLFGSRVGLGSFFSETRRLGRASREVRRTGKGSGKGLADSFPLDSTPGHRDIKRQ